MKKILLLMALMASVVFTGCSKDEDGGTNELTGTTWIFVETGTRDMVAYEWTNTISFTSGNKCTVSYQEKRLSDGAITDSDAAVASYTFESPTVKIISGGGITETMTISGNTMSNGNMVFTKR